MVFVGCAVGGQSGKKVGNATNFRWIGSKFFWRRVLRRDVAEGWSGLEELKELRREFVCHGEREMKFSRKT